MFGPLLITPDVRVDEIGRNRWRVRIDVSTPVPPAAPSLPENSGLVDTQIIVAALVRAAAAIGTGLLGYLALRALRSRQ